MNSNLSLVPFVEVLKSGRGGKSWTRGILAKNVGQRSVQDKTIVIAQRPITKAFGNQQFL